MSNIQALILIGILFAPIILVLWAAGIHFAIQILKGKA